MKDEKELKIEKFKKYRFAHRGLHHKPDVPENSLMAFKKAVEAGFGIELDVHLTKDDKLAVIHDSSLKRVTTVRDDHMAVLPENAGIPSGCRIGSQAIIEEITLDEAKEYNLEESSQKIPELIQVLELVGGRTPIIVELKSHGNNRFRLVDSVMDKLRDYKGVYVIESFDPLCILYLRRHYPDVIRGQLACDILKDAKTRVKDDPREQNNVSTLVNVMIRDLLTNSLTRPDFTAYKFEHRNNSRFKRFKGVKVFWTIQSEEDMLEAERLGALCIFERFVPSN